METEKKVFVLVRCAIDDDNEAIFADNVCSCLSDNIREAVKKFGFDLLYMTSEAETEAAVEPPQLPVGWFMSIAMETSEQYLARWKRFLQEDEHLDFDEDPDFSDWYVVQVPLIK
jgi:hypothetical protein